MCAIYLPYIAILVKQFCIKNFVTLHKTKNLKFLRITVTDLLVVDLHSSLAYFMMIHPRDPPPSHSQQNYLHVKILISC